MTPTPAEPGKVRIAHASAPENRPAMLIDYTSAAGTPAGGGASPIGSAASPGGRPRRQRAVGLPAPGPRAPVGREDAAALHRDERHDGLRDAEAGAQHVVDGP